MSTPRYRLKFRDAEGWHTVPGTYLRKEIVDLRRDYMRWLDIPIEDTDVEELQGPPRRNGIITIGEAIR